MIGSLRGVLLERLAVADRTAGIELLVEVGGVGYRLVVPAGTSAVLGEAGSPVFLHVHTHVREDAIVLYGFATREERVCFEALLGAHGVGPGLALAILSVHSPAALRRALFTDDVDALTLVPGVGKKTAARLLLELKSRLYLPELDGLRDLAVIDLASAAAGANAGGTDGPGAANGHGAVNGHGAGASALLLGREARAEVRAALAGLGYSADEVREAVLGLPDGDDPAELLRHALRNLGASR